MSATLSEKGLHILQHSLGLDQYGRGEAYRNHFVTGTGSKDHADCLNLVSMGFMTCRSGHPLSGGDDVFRVTDAGRAAVSFQSPAPPKVSRSKQRYLDYLACDSDVPFGEWLKTRFGSHKERKSA